jgi:MutS-like protein
MSADAVVQTPQAAPAAAYATLRGSYQAEEARLARLSLRYSIARGVVFGIFVGALFWLLAASRQPTAPLAAAAAALVLFVVLAILHARHLRRLRRVAELRRINEEGGARVERNWDGLPQPTEPPRDRELPLARDLDLYGRASMFHLLGTAHTPAAKAALRDWLQSAARPAEVTERQEAVLELAPRLDYRQALELTVRPMEKHPPDCEPFLQWAEDEPWLRRRPGLLWAVRGWTLATLGVAACCATGTWPIEPLLAVLLLNFVLSAAFEKRVGPSLARVAARRDEMLRYADALRHVVSEPFTSPRLRRVGEALAPAGGEAPAHAALAKLESYLGLAEVRHAAPLHFPLQLLTLWDVHILALLERWQEGPGRNARRWLAGLGEMEALAAFAALRFDNPDWCQPQVAAGVDRLTARDLGHPLLPSAARVGNDVAVGPAGTFLLVTGSNMSGKSTLLRAIGLNTALAQAGAPACAAALSLPPLRLATSILVEDSLASGISFFLAELLRVKQVVAAAETARADGIGLLYLLDEVLRGTNSSERQIAVRRVLRHLLAQGALGAVSTHDLDLAAGAGLTAAANSVHFRETLGDDAGAPRMSFDYTLRPGLATTTNALELLRLVGLDLPAGDETPRPG